MKTFHMNPNQKKWALTATLVAILGLNLSTPFQGKVQSNEFASTAAEKREFVGANGQKYQLDVSEETIRGEKKTVVAVTAEFEGRNCPANGECLQDRVLDVPVTDLAAIQKALEAKFAQSARDEDEDEDTEEMDKEERKLAKDQEALDKILDQCDRSRSSRDEEYKRSSCLVNKFVQLLKKNRKKENKIDAELALSFFEENIAPDLLATLTSKDLNSLQGSNAVRVKGMDLVEKLQSGLPSGYNEIRTAAKNLSVEAFAKYATDFQTEKAEVQNQKNVANQKIQEAKALMNQANSTSDMGQRQMLLEQASMLNQQGLALQSDAMQRDSQLYSKHASLKGLAANGFKVPLADGLSQALSAGLVDRSYVQDTLFKYDSETLSALNKPVVTDMLQDMINQNNSTLSGGSGTQLPTENSGAIGGTIGRGVRYNNQNNQFKGGATLPRTAGDGRLNGF